MISSSRQDLGCGRVAQFKSGGHPFQNRRALLFPDRFEASERGSVGLAGRLEPGGGLGAGGLLGRRLQGSEGGGLGFVRPQRRRRHEGGGSQGRVKKTFHLLSPFAKRL